jgi:hypothetical protein
VAKNEEPQDQPDSHLVQSVINTDDIRTHQRYDEKRMLSEFAQYIAPKEQLISMSNCLSFISFAWLVIRGYGQPLYKSFHHRKLVAKIKRQYNERKNDLLATFGYANYNVWRRCSTFITPDEILLILLLPVATLGMNCIIILSIT